VSDLPAWRVQFVRSRWITGSPYRIRRNWLHYHLKEWHRQGLWKVRHDDQDEEQTMAKWLNLGWKEHGKWPWER
jgi:hypothetical protein